MKKIIIAALLALTINAWASPAQQQPNNDNQATAGSVSVSGSNAQNVTDVKVGQTTQVGVGQATHVATTTGNQSVTISNPANTKTEVSGTQTMRFAPDVSLGSLHPTSPCMGSSNIGGSGIGFSFGVGTSWTDDECGIRETARSFMGMNLMQDAIAIMCSSKYAAAAPACNK